MGAGTSVQEPARPGPPDSPGEEEKKSQQEAGDQHPAGGAGDKSVQKNGQISGIQGDAEDPKALDSKSEQLNGIQEEVVDREVGQGDPAVVSGGEETEEMELNEKEVPVENEGGEQKAAQQGDELPTETGEPAEEVQAAEIGFKKVFKFVGLKFTMKKEKPVKSEPVQLLTVTWEEGGVVGEEGGVAGEVASESQRDVEGSTEANASPADEADGSPPEILSPEKAEDCTEEEETKMLDTEEVPAAAESGANAAESPAVESPLKRFFRQGFFLGLRRKQSFKKAKDEPLVIGEKTETNGERAGDAGSEVTECGPEAQPSTSQEAAEVLTVQSPEEHGGEEEDFEDLTAELADVMVASEAPTVAESRTPEVKENGAPAEQSLVATDLGMGQQIPSTGKSPEGQAGVESPAPEASAELQAEHEEGAQEQPSVTNSEPVSDEGEFVASQRPKQQDSPLKKLFTSSSIKKLSAKKAKGKREETRAGDADDEAKLQSSTESEGSPDSSKPDSPPAFPEEVGEGIPAEVTESGSLPAAEQEEANGDGERKKEPITAWASFKKLVTPRKRPKGPPESERDDEPTDKAKSATLSSAESTASEKQEEPKSNGEEVKLERSTEDPKKKADAPVTWEALICVGSSKKRTRKVSDSELQKSNEEAQGSEANGQVQEHAEEAKVGSPQGPDLEQGGTSPECAESPVEGEASDGVISTWESFKRLVTPRRKSRSKLEERGEEFVPSPEAALPEAEPAKEESWVSLKKLIPGRRKKRSDVKPEQLQAESAGKDVAWAEITGSKSEEESSETPAVVPLSEYDAVDDEREHEQRLKAGTDAVQVADGVLATSEAPQLGVGQTSAGERGPLEAVKSSVDERSPSWISAAVSDVIEEEVEDKTGLAEETVAVQKQEVLVGEPTPEEGVCDLSPDEVAEEAQEVVPKVVATSDYPAEESFTEETTEMVSAVSQLTETPVTTAEGTPVREDEALVSRQTREVLEEAAQKVKLSVDPIVSCCQMGAPPGTRGDGPGPDTSAGKSPSEGVHGSSETQAAEPARKAAEKISEVATVGPPVGGNVLAGPGEATEQETRVEMQEVALVQGIASAAVEQELKPVAAPEGDHQPLPLAECQGVDESMTATTVSKDEALLVEEVSPEKVEIVREQTLEAEETEVVREQSVKIAEEGDREELGATVPVTEKVGAEQVAECGKTEVVAAGKDEAVMERVGAATSEDAQQVGVERVEAAAAAEDTENVPEVGAEKALAERTEDAGVPEIPVEQSVETPVKVEQSVTEAVSIEETGQISPPAGVSQVETSEEHVEVTPAVSVTEVLPGEGAVKTIAVELTKVESCVEPSGITSAVGVTEVVCGEEITRITPVGITEVVLGEEPIEIIPVVGVTEAVYSEETTEITPVGVTEAVLGEEPIEIAPKVDVTEVTCRGIGEISPGEATEMVRSEETTELAPVGVTEAVLRQEPTEITPAAGVTEAICSEETTELTPVGVAEALLGKDPIEIIPAAGVTEILVGEETIELTPVGVTEALLGEEPIEIPVGVTEVVCSEETTEITPVGVTEAVLGEEPIEITPAVEVTEVTCRGIEIAPEGATAAVCGEKTTGITPVEVTEIISGEQPAGISPPGVTEVVPGKEPIDVAPTVGVTEVVCSKETTESTLAVVLESLPSEEPMRITPTVGMTEAVCGEETTELAPLGVTKVIPSEEAFGITHVTVTKVLSEETVKVSSVDLSEALPGEEQIAVTAVGVTEVCGEDSIEIAAVVHSEAADAASAEAGVEESKSEREGEAPRQGANEEDVQKVMDSEAAQEQLTPVEIVQQDMGAEIVETAMDEAVCEELVESPEGQRTQEALADSLGLATQILQSTTAEGPSKETNETTTTKVASTEAKSETVCDELEGMKSVQPAAEETDTTLAIVSRDQGETPPGEHPEKSLTEAAETQAGEASAAKQVETGATCVTSELLSTTSEGTTLEQALDVVEPAEEVECKLASEERDKPAPDESIEKISLKAGELGRGDQPAVTSQVQSVSVPKPCQHTEGAAELQSDVELKSSSSDSLVKEQPLALSAPQTPVGFSKEKCEVDAETICPTVESAPEVKLHVASVDEFQVLQNEMVTLMEDLPVVKSSESCEEAFLVTVSSVEEKVIAETVTTVSAEIPEPSAVDQVLPPCEDVKQVSVVETAAVIVEAAIEVATGCMSSTRDDSETVLTTDVQEAESCRKEQLEDQLAECKIKETVTQKLECLETWTEVEVSQTQTFEQRSAQAAQVLSQDPLVLTRLQGRESTKEGEKLLRLQKDTAIEGTSEVVDQRFQTSGNQDFEGKESVLMQSAEMVLQTTVRGGQESIETETLASMHTELGRESSDDTSGNISISSEVTRAECCQSLEQPEATRPSIELTKQTQLVTIQQIGEEQTSLHDAQGGMISLTGELANENEVEAVQLNREAMDQSQSVGTDEKQSHEVETEPSVELAKGAAERTPS